MKNCSEIFGPALPTAPLLISCAGLSSRRPLLALSSFIHIAAEARVSQNSGGQVESTLLSPFRWQVILATWQVILATLRGQATRHSRVVGEGTHVQVKIKTVVTHQTRPSSPNPSCGEMANPLPCSWTSSSNCETSYQIGNAN